MSGPTDLLARTAELVAVPSVSHGERALAALVEGELRRCPGLAVERVGATVVARRPGVGEQIDGTTLGRPRRLVLAGHLDTVPPAANATPRVEGDVLWGVGSADMKGGLAVMRDLARAVTAPAVDVTWCFYACEEVGRDESGLAELWAQRPDLLAGDAAVLGEPTDARVEAGCQGTLRAVVHLVGVRAHTARPFTGRNAIHRLAPLLGAVAAWVPRAVAIDGCTYTEQLQAVDIAGGVAGNVVPDAASVTLNYRFAPDRDAAAARAVLAALVEGVVDPDLGGRLEVVDQADGAPPALADPSLAALVAGSGEAPRAKVGWTDVASFWAHGVPAANFGPGDPLLAHHPDEHVTRVSLERARAVLGALLGAPG